MTRTQRPSASPITDLFDWPTRRSCALIFVVCLVIYLPALSGGFIWDDHPGHVTRPDLQSLGGLWRIWFNPGATQQYYPLLHSAFWLEHKIWGESAFAYHLLNVLLHATAACLLGVTLRRLAVRGAWLAAVLFAVHPVAVESVAWISEQKNTLSAVFYFCAALAYVRFADDRQPRRYALATFLFVLALATKTVTATLPAALLVIFWWRSGRAELRRHVGPLAPWFGLAAVAGLTTAWVERTMIGAAGATFALDALQRALLAGRVIVFYLTKLLWPADLIFVYPRWQIDGSAVGQYLFPLVVAGVLIALAMRQPKFRGVLAGSLLFIGTLFPALGFVNVYPFQFSFVADHFQYLASAAIFALVAAGLVGTSRLSGALRHTAAWGLVIILGFLTWRHAHDYHDVITLYETTLRKNPEAWLAHNNLAEALTARGQPEEAIPHLETAIKLKPDFALAENNLGDDLRRVGRPQEAIPHLERALTLQSRFPEAHNNLGVVLAMLGRHGEARREFETAITQNPQYAQAQVNLGLSLAASGHPADAIAHFQTAVQLDPNSGDAELNWAIALTLTRRFPEAAPHFERAIRLQPASADAVNFYGRALAENSRYEEAVPRFREALQLNPNHADAHFNLGVALRQLGRLDEAQQHLEAARRLGR